MDDPSEQTSDPSEQTSDPSEQTSAPSDNPPRAENQDPSSGYDSSSMAESSSMESDGIVCKKNMEHGCLKNTTCLKDKCLNDLPCLKDTEVLDSETSTESCLMSKKHKNKAQEATGSEPSDKDKSSAVSTSTGIVDSSVATSGDSSEAPPSKTSESGTDAGAQTDDAPQDCTVDAESSKAATDDSSREVQKASVEKPGWTLSEDSALRGMKLSKDELTWVDIATALGRNKDEVKARWTAIKNQSVSGDSKKEQITNHKAVNSGKERAQKETETKGEADSHMKGKAKTEPNDTAKANAKANIPFTPENRVKGKALTTQHDVANGMTTPENKPPEKKAKATQNDHDYSLYEEEASSEFSWSDYPLPQERREQTRYLHRHIYSELYPGYIEPEPDEFFGPRDCEVLASIESKYQRSKWLEMQANFYNVTGRLVPLYMIKERCERAAEEERQEREEARRARQRAKRVEEWVNKVPDEGCEDPES